MSYFGFLMNEWEKQQEYEDRMYEEEMERLKLEEDEDDEDDEVQA